MLRKLSYLHAPLYAKTMWDVGHHVANVVSSNPPKNTITNWTKELEPDLWHLGRL